MMLFFLFLSLPIFTEQQNEKVEPVDILSALNTLPKNCHKNGKTYKQGEEFEIGHLRYKCQDYGVYSMEGCTIKEGMKPLKLGESLVADNIKYQCLSHGSSVFYRETTCGILGQPDCDKIPFPKGFEEASNKPTPKPEGVTKIGNVQLPKGWQLVDGGSKKLNGTNSQVITHVFMFNPTQSKLRARRQSGHGIGRVIGVEDMSGGDSGRPMMPAEMMMKESKKNMGVSHNPKIVSTQHVGATLKTGDKNDGDLVDLNARKDKKSDTQNLQHGSVKGQKSSVKWDGRKIIVNGKEIGAGVGTFSFGNMPTSH